MAQSPSSAAQAAGSFADSPESDFGSTADPTTHHPQQEAQEDIEVVIARLQKMMAAAERQASEPEPELSAEAPRDPGLTAVSAPVPEPAVITPVADDVPNIFANNMVLPTQAEPEFIPEPDPTPSQASIRPAFRATAEWKVDGVAKGSLKTEFAAIPAKKQAKKAEVAVDQVEEAYKEAFNPPDHFDFG